MTLSRTHAAPKPKNYVGIGFVAAIHLAAIYAFSNGLIHPTVKPPPPITLKPLPPDVRPEPPKPEPRLADKPVMKDIQPIPMPIPEDFAVTPEPVIGPAAMRPDAGPQSPTGPMIATTATPPQQAAKPQVQAPGAVCSVMPRPELPVVNWSGDAVLQVLATVRGGRVVGSDFRVVQGALDGKTKRSLQRSVESALAGYQCQGDATFQQDFAFQLD